jgi:nucleoside-diphosphate-sugar epimerase
VSLQHRILVTGGTGFLGSHIVRRARFHGCEVAAGHRAATGNGTVHLDVCDETSVVDAFRAVRPYLVIHCASYGVNYADQDAQHAFEVNTRGSWRVLQTAALYGTSRFVHVGSCFEYGDKAGPISEDSPLSPTAVYGATKAAATVLLCERARTLGVNLVVARPFGMWGPGEAGYRLIPQVIAACLERRNLKLTTCEVVRDYSYVEDVADTIVELALTPNIPAGAIVNVASGRGMVLRDFVLSVARSLNGEELMHFGKLEYRPTEMLSLVADVQKLRQLLGERRTTALPDGLKRMVSMHATGSAALRS